MSETTAILEVILLKVSECVTEMEGRINVLENENNHLRVLALKAGCHYGHMNEKGVCSLGYPGCGCIDDLMALFNLQDMGDRSNSEPVEAGSTMRRDPNRIPRILEQIEIIWRKNPDMRLCQLISNYVNDARDHVKFYNQEDTVTEHLLEGVVNDIK